MDTKPFRNPVSFREFILAALGFLLFSTAFCSSVAFLPADVAPFNTGDALGSYFPYMGRSFHPLSKEIAGPWDPTMWTGLPESHSPFGRYLPTVWPLFELLPFGAALTWLHILHHALAGLGTYLLMRVCGFSKGGACMAGLVFTFSSFMALHRAFITMFTTCVWLPWVFWSLELFRRTGRWLWVVMTGTFLAFHVLGGHSQMIVMSAPMWILYGVYFTRFGEGTRRERLTFGLGVLTACVLGVIGGLPQLLPLLEVGSWTPYQEFSFDYFKGGSFELRWLPWLAGQWVLGGNYGIPDIPNCQGVLDSGCFFGLIPLALAVLGSAASWRLLRGGAVYGLAPTRRETIFWLLLFWINLLLMLGRNTPLYRAMAFVPVYNMFHIPARHLWIVALGVAWLTALGYDQLAASAGRLRLRMLIQVACAFLVLAGICLWVIVPHQEWKPKPTLAYPGFQIAIASAIVTLVMIGLALWTRRMRPVLLGLLLALTFFELRFAFGNYILGPFPTETLLAEKNFPDPVHWLRDTVKQEAGGGAVHPPRCIMSRTWIAKGIGGWVPGAWGSSWGVSVLNCYSQSMPGSLARLLSLNKYGETRFQTVLFEERGLSATGGRFILNKGPLEPIAPGLGYLEARRHEWQWGNRPTGDTNPITIESSSQIAGRIATFQRQPYLVEGEIICSQPQARIRVTVHEEPATANRVEREFASGSSIPFALILPPPTSKYAAIRVVVENIDAGIAEVKTCNLWCVTKEIVAKVNTDPDELARRLRGKKDDRYLFVTTCDPEVNIFENPRARALASLVQEIRPAESHVAAANSIIQNTDRPVKELAYVTVPDGQSHELRLSGPRYFSGGTASLEKYLPDDFTFKTQAPGEAFLVLTVTRCRGWSASVDGQPASIHAVDGPLMGVVVPPGEHEVRLQFRPVLLIAGMTAAGVGLGGGWLLVLLSPILRRKRPTVRREATQMFVSSCGSLATSATRSCL